MSNMVVEFLLFGQTPAFQADAMRKNGVVVFSIAHMRGNGKSAIHAWTHLDIFGIRLNAILGHDGRRLDRRGFGWRRVIAEEAWFTSQIVSWTTVQQRAQIWNKQRVLDVS